MVWSPTEWFGATNIMSKYPATSATRTTGNYPVPGLKIGFCPRVIHPYVAYGRLCGETARKMVDRQRERSPRHGVRVMVVERRMAALVRQRRRSQNVVRWRQKWRSVFGMKMSHQRDGSHRVRETAAVGGGRRCHAHVVQTAPNASHCPYPQQ